MFHDGIGKARGERLLPTEPHETQVSAMAGAAAPIARLPDSIASRGVFGTLPMPTLPASLKMSLGEPP
jgi:hypothetical protein